MGFKPSDFNGSNTKSSSHANRGRNLESVILASQSNVVALTKITAGQKWLKGGKTVSQKQFVDFVGCVNLTGQMLCFDAKQWDDGKCRLDLVPPFQRELLRRYQLAGAIAGLLIESTKLGRFFWFEEYPLFDPIGWGSIFLKDIGPNTHGVSFAEIVKYSLSIRGGK